MKILVTGSRGFLGRHLCRRLLERGDEVTLLVRPGSRSESVPDLNVRYAIGDITDLESLRRAVRGQDVVIHAAAVTGDSISSDDSLQFRVNVEGTRNVVSACRTNRVDRLLHVSSVAAIGIPSDSRAPANEEFEFNLEHAGLSYHLSKHRAEQEVFIGVQRGLAAVVVNPAFVFGWHRSEYRGAHLVSRVRGSRLVPYFTGGICAVHVLDVVDGILLALRRGQSGHRYILGGDNLTFRSLLAEGANALNVHPTFVPVPPFVTAVAARILQPWSRLIGRRPRVTYAMHYWTSHHHFYESNKARAELGYSPRSFSAILDECLGSNTMEVPQMWRGVPQRLTGNDERAVSS